MIFANGCFSRNPLALTTEERNFSSVLDFSFTLGLLNILSRRVMRDEGVGKSAGMEKMGNVGGGRWGWGRWKSGSGGWRMEPWDGRFRLVGLASGSVYRKQMGYACSTPYFTRIYCLLFRVADDIGPCLPRVSVNVVNSCTTPVPLPPLESREPNQGQNQTWDFFYSPGQWIYERIRNAELLGSSTNYVRCFFLKFTTPLCGFLKSRNNYFFRVAVKRFACFFFKRESSPFWN